MATQVDQSAVGSPLHRSARRHNSKHAQRNTNVADTERWLSAVGGSMLAVYGLRRRDLPGLGLAALGGALLERGVTGHCVAYSTLGVSTAGGELHARSGPADMSHAKHARQARDSMTIDRPRAELYAAWHDFSRLPSFMDKLERVDVLSPTRSHWVAKAPAGMHVEWDAEITEDRENERIAWRAVEPADVPNRGSVEFSDAPGDRGTVVTVTLDYSLPAGVVGNTVAKLFGDAPEQEVRDSLRRFKQVSEAGEVPSTKGQPTGRR